MVLFYRYPLIILIYVNYIKNRNPYIILGHLTETLALVQYMTSDIITTAWYKHNYINNLNSGIDEF